MSDDIEARQLCTFTVDGILFGVDVKDVQEVIRYQAMTPVPLAPETVTGLINLRGQIVTAIDLRRRLAAAPRAAEPMNIIIRVDDAVLSLLVDEIGDVIEIDETQLERPPENLDPIARSLVDGIYKHASELILLIDTRKASSLESPPQH